MASVAQPTSFNIEYWRHSDCVRQAELKPIVARRLQCTGPILTTIVLELLAFRPRWLKVSHREVIYLVSTTYRKSLAKASFIFVLQDLLNECSTNPYF